MIATLSTDLSQRFGPVPAIGQDINLARNRQDKGSDDLLSQGNLCAKWTAPPRAFRMIQLSPQRQKKLLTEQGRQNPLMAKDIGHVLSMILMPTTTGNLLASLLGQRVIHDNKDNVSDRNPQCLKEFKQSGLGGLLCRPFVFSQESSKAAKRSTHRMPNKEADHRGCVNFLAQLDETDDKAREELKRRS